MSPSSARGIDFLLVFSPRIILINVSPHLKLRIAFLPGEHKSWRERKVHCRVTSSAILLYRYLFLRRGLQEHQTSDPYTFATENTSSLELRSSIPLTIISEQTIRALATSPPFEEIHARTFHFTPNMHQWNPTEIFSGPWRLWPAIQRPWERTARTDTQD